MTISEGSDFALEIPATANGDGDWFQFQYPDPHRWSLADISPFSPRSGTGDVSLSDYTHISAFEQTNFAGGFGQVNMVEANRYYDADFIDTTKQGAVTLNPAFGARRLTDMEGGGFFAAAATNGSGGDAFVGAEDKVYRWDGSTATDETDAGWGGGDIYDFLWNGEKLFIAVRSNPIHYWNGSGWTQITGDTHDATALAIHGGYHWYAQGDSNLVHFWSLSDGSDAEVDILDTIDSDHPDASASGDPGAVQVGPLGQDVKRLISFNNALYAFRNDGVWRIVLEGEDYVAYQEFDFGKLDNSDNFVGVEVWNGHLYFNVRQTLYRYSGATLTDVTPPVPSELAPSRITQTIRGLFGLGPYLFVITEYEDDTADPLTSDITGYARIYLYDGVGWHPWRKYELGASEFIRGGAFAYRAGAREMVVLVKLLGGDSALLNFEWRATSEVDPPFSLEGDLMTSWFDGGLIAIPKHWSILRVWGHVPEDGGSISVEAQSDDGDSISTISLGSLDFDDMPGTAPSGTMKKALKELTFNVTDQGKRIRFEFTLDRGVGNTWSPVLLGYLLEYVLRPDTVVGMNIPTTIGTQKKGGRYAGVTSKHSPAELYAALRDARDSVTPCRFRDRLGHDFLCYVSAIEVREAHRQPAHSDKSSATADNTETYTLDDGNELLVTFSLVEVTN